MSCPERQPYIATTNNLSGLEDRLNEAFEEIRTNFSSAQTQGTQAELILKRRSDGQVLYTLPDSVRVLTLEKGTWNLIFGSGSVRGCYYPLGDKILLKKENWCRKTMIHECLHRVSIFSHQRNRNLFEMTKPFAEGLTEFMTGLLLWRAHGTCYENWRLGRFLQWCSVSYSRETKSFLALCRFVNVQSLLDFYLGTQTNDFIQAWSSFIATIRNDTGKQFRNVFRDGERFGLMIAFRNECERQFGKEFRKLQRLIDYNRVLGSVLGRR